MVTSGSPFASSVTVAFTKESPEALSPVPIYMVFPFEEMVFATPCPGKSKAYVLSDGLHQSKYL